MAGSSASTILTSSGTGGKTNLSVSWSETGTSVSNNTSTISVSATMTYNTAMWDVTNSGTLRAYWHDNRSNSDVEVAALSFNEFGYNTKTRTASGSITVTHKDDGTLSGYGFARWTQGSSYGGYVPSSGDAVTGWVDLTTIARASQPSINTYPDNTPDFNIGDTITIHMNRKSSSFTHTVKINHGSTSTTIATGVTNNCTFNTSTIASTLYALMPSAKSYSNTISVTTYNGSTAIGTKTCAYNAKAVEANSKPVFSNFTYADTNSAITAITGNNQYLVQGKSSLRVTISSANKATARLSASMSSYATSISGLSATASYSTSDVNINFSSSAFTVGQQTLAVRATDSRGYSTSVTKNVNVLAYANPVVNATAVRLNNFENQTTLTVGGTYSPLTINGTAKNTVSSVQYRYKSQSTSTWGSWTNMTGLNVTSAGTYTTTAKVLDLANTSAYDFEVKTTDRIGSTTVSLTVSVGIPIFRIGTDGYVYNQEQRIITENTLTTALLNKIYPVGSIYMSMTNTSPQSFLGGTWTQIAQGRTLVGVNTNETEFNTVNKTGGSKTVALTVSQMPSHSHTVNTCQGGNSNNTANDKVTSAASNATWNNNAHAERLIQNEGGNQAHNNLQPYLTCYMWRRTA